MTRDIIRACVDEWRNGWRNCMEFSRQFNRNAVYSTSHAIFEFLVKNITYKVDPSGKQWIRTPGRLLLDGTGDCKSYSILTASVLTCLGIPCVMRFVSYDNGEYSHVYVVAFDEQGREITIDAVACVQLGKAFNKEITYVKKRDMRGTEISRLSGIGNPEVDFNAPATSDFANNKVNVNNMNAILLYFDSLAQIGSFTADMEEPYFIASFALDIIKEFGNKNEDLTTAGYVVASYVGSGSNWYMDESIRHAVLSEIRSYITNSVEKGKFVVSSEFEAASADFLTWWQNAVVAANYTAPLSGNDAKVAAAILENAPFFLYTVIANSRLSKIALEKKVEHEDILNSFISQSGISYEAALFLVQSGIMLSSDMEVFEYLKKFKDSGSSSVGAIDWDKIMQVVSSTADSFAKVYDSVTQGQNSPGKVKPLGPVAPSPSDFSTSWLPVVVGLGLLGGGIYLLKNKKKGKK